MRFIMINTKNLFPIVMEKIQKLPSTTTKYNKHPITAKCLRQKKSPDDT